MGQLTQFLRSSIRGRLACLVLAVTLPAMVLVAVLVVQAYRNERDSVARHLVATARAISAVVDHQIGESESLLIGLASSQDLAAGDLGRFEAHVRSIRLGEDRWIVLTDETGQQLINTHVPQGHPLPQQIFSGEFKSAMDEGRVYISNLMTGAATQRPVIFIAVPVMRDGRLRYTLNYVMFPSAFAATLNVDRFSPGMVVSIVDREGRIAARHPHGDRYVGQMAMPDIVAATASRAESMNESTTLEGTRVLAVHSRASISGWSVAMGAPYAALFASAQQLLWTGVGVSVVLMSIASFMAVWIGRAVVRSVDSLVGDTEAIGRGAIPEARSSGLSETDFVAEAMRRTARRLEAHERENAALTIALKTELDNVKRAEVANRRLAAIVEFSDDAIIGNSLHGTITSWNQGAERIYGYTAGEMLGQCVKLLLPDDRLDEDSVIMERIRNGERIEQFETFRRRKDGSLVAISLTISPVRDHDGHITGASKIARDVSQRRRTEFQQQALYELVASVNRAAALSEIYDAALEAMARCQNADRAAILLYDEEGVMRFAATRSLSEKYCRVAEGHSPWKASDAEPAPLWIDDVARATLTPELREAIEGEGIRALAFVPLTYEKRLLGKFMLYYDAPHDFTPAELRPVETIASQVAFAIERQKSAHALEALVDERTASLRQVVAQMEEFSYSVSHDLRAPVRAMCGYAEAVLQDHGTELGNEGRDLLARIQRNSQRMDRLIQDLLTYSRLSRREINLEPVSVDKLVHEVMQQYPDMRPERADIEVVGSLPDVLAHEPSLTQVVSNLLSNAVKFVPATARPRVRIGFEQTSTQARFWFVDNGIGIKPESQGRLFRMFERVHGDQNYEGTGIGLAIVRKAIERMNGTVGVESDGVSGSKFWFELPIATRTVRVDVVDATTPVPSSQV